MKHSEIWVEIHNKKAFLDYEIINTYEAGLRLFWEEVKSVRLGLVNLKWSYVTIRGNEVILLNTHIPHYKNWKWEFDPKRERTLLMKKYEITHLRSQLHEGGFTLILTNIYSKGNLIKGKIALAKWRKTWQKKQVLKERDLDRETSISIKKRYFNW
jgi:SsrA-binding protein